MINTMKSRIRLSVQSIKTPQWDCTVVEFFSGEFLGRITGEDVYPDNVGTIVNMIRRNLMGNYFLRSGGIRRFHW